MSKFTFIQRFWSRSETDTTNDVDLAQMHPHSVKMCCLDFFRFLGSIIFMVDYSLKYIYWKQSRFITDDLFNMYGFFLITRVLFIIFFHVYRLFCSCYGLGFKIKRGFNPKMVDHRF